jgi:hypothetical protein
VSGSREKRMSKFVLRVRANNNLSFCHIINFFTAYEIMSLDEARPMFHAWHSRGEDVTVDIPDELDSNFKETLNSLNAKYE